MSSKTFFIVCAQAVLLQVTLAQVIYPGSTVTGNSIVDNNIVIGSGAFGSNAFGSNAFGSNAFGSNAFGSNAFGSLAGYGSSLSSNAANGIISSGVLSGIGGYNVVPSGPLAVTTISPIGPSGLAVASENAIEGILAVSGQLPYLSAVAFEGALPTAGSGVATCGCGSGTVGIVSEGFPANAGNIGFGVGNLGYGAGNLGLANGLGLGAGIGGRSLLY